MSEAVKETVYEKFIRATTDLVFKERFYASLLNKMRISWSKTKVPTAGVYVTDKINLVLNPDFVEKLDTDELVELLRHECNHIVYRHITRAKELGIEQDKKGTTKTDEDYTNAMIKHKLFNLSADTAINHDCRRLVNNHGGVDHNKLQDMLIQQTGDNSIKIDSKQSMEHYYGYVSQIEEDMQDQAKELGDKLKELLENGNIDDHGIWDESTGGSDLIDQVIKNAVGKAAKEARAAGRVSSDLDAMINDLLSSKVDWRRELNKFFINSLKYEKERTRKKRNRRYGYIFSGRKKKPMLSLAVLMDVSGSMSDEQVSQIFTEIDKIHTYGVEIHVIQMDTEVKHVELYDPKKEWKRLGCGGTAYQSGIDYAKDKLEVDCLIICGDMDTADTPSNPNIPVLWVGVGTKQDKPGNFGKIIYIE
jgi:predicted metal-dependent peptidase